MYFVLFVCFFLGGGDKIYSCNIKYVLELIFILNVVCIFVIF